MKKQRTAARSFSLLALCVLVCMLLAACGGKAGKEISASVSIRNGSEVLLEETVTLKGVSPTAEDALLEACQKEKLAYQNKDGLYDGFGGVASTQTDGWLFYFNGALAETGVADAVLSEDGENTIEMRYENYDAAFSE